MIPKDAVDELKAATEAHKLSGKSVDTYFRLALAVMGCRHTPELTYGFRGSEPRTGGKWDRFNQIQDTP